MNNNKNKLRTELNNLYGGRNGFLSNRDISGFVSKFNGGNTFNIKKQAYKKAYTKYMNYMAGEFAQDVLKEIRRKMKTSPTCPSGVEGGGPSFRGTASAVIGGIQAACGGQGKPRCNSVANHTRSKTSQK